MPDNERAPEAREALRERMAQRLWEAFKNGRRSAGSQIGPDRWSEVSEGDRGYWEREASALLSERPDAPGGEQEPDAVRIGLGCEHCGKPLAVVRDRGSIIAGLHNLEYVHADTGLADCEPAPATTARPYDGWAATRAYEAALRPAVPPEEERSRSGGVPNGTERD